MMNDELYANLRQLSHSEINGRQVWLFEIDCSLGEIQIVQYEMPGKELKEKFFRWDYPSAKKYYTSICRKLLDQKI